MILDRRAESRGVARITESAKGLPPGPPPDFGFQPRANRLGRVIGRDVRYLGHVYDGTRTVVTFEVIDRD